MEEGNTILAITVPLSLRQKIRERAKELAYLSESEYARQILRREVEEGEESAE